MNIDWSKAPEGATGAMIANFSDEDSGISPGFVEFIGFDGADDRDVYDEGEDAWIFFAKPSAWNGEGLPPVGTVCEVAPPIHWAGTKVRVLCHEEGDAICRVMEGDMIGDLKQLMASEVRPLRTPEQIAAEEREKAVDEMVKVWKRTMGRFAHEERGLAEMLYDHGYRKQEQPK